MKVNDYSNIELSTVDVEVLFCCVFSLCQVGYILQKQQTATRVWQEINWCNLEFTAAI